MPRRSPKYRLATLADAATVVFGRLGYKRTHVADVASEAGVSAGSVYSYVASKEALFHLVFLHGFGLLANGTPELPIATPEFVETFEVISAGLRRLAGTPLLRAALDVADPPDVRAELEAIVLERYAMTDRLWPLLAVIERSAVDLPELDEYYFARGRRGQHGQLARYIQSRAAAGYFRPQEDPVITARLMTEAITWFAWHRRQDRDGAAYDDDVARRTVVDVVCNGLVAP